MFFREDRVATAYRVRREHVEVWKDTRRPLFIAIPLAIGVAIVVLLFDFERWGMALLALLMPGFLFGIFYLMPKTSLVFPTGCRLSDDRVEFTGASSFVMKWKDIRNWKIENLKDIQGYRRLTFWHRSGPTRSVIFNVDQVDCQSIQRFVGERTSTEPGEGDNSE